METLRIIDWKAFGATALTFAAVVLAFRIARRLDRCPVNSPRFLRTAAFPTLVSLALVAYGSFSILWARMPVPGGAEHTGTVAVLGGSLLLAAGFGLEAMLLRPLRRVARRGPMGYTLRPE